MKEEDPRLVVRLTFTFGTLHGTFDQSELEPERWLQLHDGRFVPVGGLCGADLSVALEKGVFCRGPLRFSTHLMDVLVVRRAN